MKSLFWLVWGEKKRKGGGGGGGGVDVNINSR